MGGMSYRVCGWLSTPLSKKINDQFQTWGQMTQVVLYHFSPVKQTGRLLPPQTLEVEMIRQCCHLRQAAIRYIACSSVIYRGWVILSWPNGRAFMHETWLKLP